MNRREPQSTTITAIPTSLGAWAPADDNID
jgi:hypothetical protein